MKFNDVYQNNVHVGTTSALVVCRPSDTVDIFESGAVKFSKRVTVFVVVMDGWCVCSFSENFLLKCVLKLAFALVLTSVIYLFFYVSNHDRFLFHKIVLICHPSDH